jgi:hypothetical protein
MHLPTRPLRISCKINTISCVNRFRLASRFRTGEGADRTGLNTNETILTLANVTGYGPDLNSLSHESFEMRNPVFFSAI